MQISTAKALKNVTFPVVLKKPWSFITQNIHNVWIQPKLQTKCDIQITYEIDTQRTRKIAVCKGKDDRYQLQEMTEILELSDKDFNATIIKMLLYGVK